MDKYFLLQNKFAATENCTANYLEANLSSSGHNYYRSPLRRKVNRDPFCYNPHFGYVLLSQNSGNWGIITERSVFSPQQRLLRQMILAGEGGCHADLRREAEEGGEEGEDVEEESNDGEPVEHACVLLASKENEFFPAGPERGEAEGDAERGLGERGQHQQAPLGQAQPNAHLYCLQASAGVHNEPVWRGIYG